MSLVAWCCFFWGIHQSVLKIMDWAWMAFCCKNWFDRDCYTKTGIPWNACKPRSQIDCDVYALYNLTMMILLILQCMESNIIIRCFVYSISSYYHYSYMCTSPNSFEDHVGSSRYHQYHCIQMYCNILTTHDILWYIVYIYIYIQ